MYKEHHLFESPEDENVKIWRYMDFYKFISILEYNSLYFPSVKILGRFDKMEGFLPRNAIDRLSNLSENEHENLLKALKETRKMLYVNSWHINEIESDAMWKIYLKSNAGLAIQSTFQRLKDSFSVFDKDIHIGKVKYVNPSDIKNLELVEAPINAFNLILHKRKSFEHERELRAALLLPKTNKTGVRVGVDLNDLIENIYVAPQCEPWIKELIGKVLKRYELKKEVEQSILDEESPY